MKAGAAEPLDMKTQYDTACSLDGFIATDDHSLEWLFQSFQSNAPRLRMSGIG